MFYYNLRHFWSYFRETAPHGAVLHLSAVDGDRILGRAAPDNCPATVLVDPDSYFWEVDAPDCPKPCEKLGTYDWLVDPKNPIWPPVLNDDAALTAAIRGSLDAQVAAGATQLILPTPLILDPTDGDRFLHWLEVGVAEAAGRSCLAMLAVGDGVLPKISDGLVDQLTAIGGIDGVYICVDTTGSAAVQMTDEAAILALLDTVYLLSRAYGLQVVVNYVDLLGIACLGLGATAFVSGYENKTRQLDFTDFGGEGGRAIPKFTSLASCTRLRPERDLLRVASKRGLLRLLTNDETASSAQLFAALRAGAGQLPPEWRETPNNVSAARTHVIELLTARASEIADIKGDSARAEFVLDWLVQAEQTVSYLNERFAESALDEDGRWVTGWRRAYETVCDKYSLC